MKTVHNESIQKAYDILSRPDLNKLTTKLRVVEKARLAFRRALKRDTNNSGCNSDILLREAVEGGLSLSSLENIAKIPPMCRA